MDVSRRDFLNGVALSVAASMTPVQFLQAHPDKVRFVQNLKGHYPPTMIGIRGNHAGSFYAPHSIARNGKTFAYDEADLLAEQYDLIIVGAGISGLAAACFYQQKFGSDKKILILENHDEFGGHATRNEFATASGVLIGYGGSESLQSPRSIFSQTSLSLLSYLGVDINALEKGFNVNFYPDLGLSRGVFFDKKHFGENKIVAGNPDGGVADDIPADKRNARSLAEFIADFPLSPTDKDALFLLHSAATDYLADLSLEQKKNWMRTHSYYEFLRDKVKLSRQAIQYFQRSTDDFFALSIDAISCAEARNCALPGLAAMGLPPLSTEDQAILADPYTFHFPDGNASLARLMVRRLIPTVATGSTMQDVVLAKFDYSKLDHPAQSVRVRLNSCVLNAKNTKQGVQVAFLHKNRRLYRVHAKHAIMAGYNMMIPYLMPQLPEAQKSALRSNVKAPLLYSNVVIRNWQAFIKLGVHSLYCPTSPYALVKLDFPVNMGGYQHAHDPQQPIVLHMVYAPTFFGRGMTAAEQFKEARHHLIGMPFERHERLIRNQLQAMLGEQGFNHHKDILAITVNRWSHGYSYSLNTLYDNEDEFQAKVALARTPLGNITIANADAAWTPYAHAAIDEAFRAVQELHKL